MGAEAKRIEAPPQNTPEWLEWRKKYMGSSDAPAALGMSRWCSPQEVAAEKKKPRTSDKHPEPESPEMRRGHVLEEVVARLYSGATGKRVDIAPSAVHPEYDWMAASPDRNVVDDDPFDRILECKTHTAWVRDQYGEPGTDEVTDYEFIQVQHQMAVTGAEAVDVAILFGENETMQLLADMLDSGNVTIDYAVTMAEQLFELAIYHVKRDEEFIATLIEAEKEFWERYVLGDEIPTDYKTIQPKSGIRTATDKENIEVVDLKETWLQKKRTDATYEEIKAWWQDQIKEAEGIGTRAGNITWKKNKDSVKAVTDWQALARYLGEEYCSPDGFEELVKEHTEEVVKPGPRVFRVPASWKKEL